MYNSNISSPLLFASLRRLFTLSLSSMNLSLLTASSFALKRFLLALELKSNFFFIGAFACMTSLLKLILSHGASSCMPNIRDYHSDYSSYHAPIHIQVICYFLFLGRSAWDILHLIPLSSLLSLIFILIVVVFQFMLTEMSIGYSRISRLWVGLFCHKGGGSR